MTTTATTMKTKKNRSLKKTKQKSLLMTKSFKCIGGGACLKMRTLMMMIYILCKNPCGEKAGGSTPTLHHHIVIIIIVNIVTLTTKCFPSRASAQNFKALSHVETSLPVIQWMQSLSHFRHVTLLLLLVLLLRVVLSNQREEFFCCIFCSSHIWFGWSLFVLSGSRRFRRRHCP